MRQIQFYIAGVELGPFDEEQVVRYFREGLLSLADLSRDEGDLEWLPLRVLISRRPLPDIMPLAEPAVPARPAKVEKGIVAPTPRAKPLTVTTTSKILSVGSHAAAARETDKLPPTDSERSSRRNGIVKLAITNGHSSPTPAPG